jgi:putative transposase
MRSIDLRPGLLVRAGDRKLELLSCPVASKIQARDLDTGEVVLISARDVDFENDRIERAPQSLSKIARSTRSIENLDQTEIELAELRYETLLPLVGKSLSKEDVSHAAEKLSVSASQIYRLISRLDVGLGFLSLVPQKRGRLKDQKTIAGDAEDIIHEMIELHYKGVGATFQKVIDKVQDRCRELGLSAPGDSTICNRIKSQGKKQLLKKTDGAKAASQKYDVRGGKLALCAPLELIQIDHALVDCTIVDSNQRLPIGRPWATLAIDVFTRSVIGIHLSLAHPSAMSVALCIAHAILPKDWWLRKYGFESTQYPFYGLPKRIHVDNAREFKSKKLKDSCRLYDIELTYRPPGVPHNGAHIERLIGTLMKRTHMLPGTTMSSVKERGDYKSEKHAALTFSEFREWFIREVEIYH